MRNADLGDSLSRKCNSISLLSWLYLITIAYIHNCFFRCSCVSEVQPTNTASITTCFSHSSSDPSRPRNIFRDPGVRDNSRRDTYTNIAMLIKTRLSLDVSDLAENPPSYEQTCLASPAYSPNKRFWRQITYAFLRRNFSSTHHHSGAMYGSLIKGRYRD